MPMFIVEVTETIVTRYRIRAESANEASNIAELDSIEHSPSRIVSSHCERDIEVVTDPTA